MLVVTGGAGFIGSNLIKGLNAAGHHDILVVDDLTDGTKFVNLLDLTLQDYMNKDDFLAAIGSNAPFVSSIKTIFHLGACSDTTEWDGRYMMQNNYGDSKTLLHFCLSRKIPFIYASSAAVYGEGRVFVEAPENERPLNVYGYSKYQFDQYVRHLMPDVSSQVVGLRYFNVYGPREQHKGHMASVAFHFNQQLKQEKKLKLFEGTEGYGHGEQRRDFVFVDDVVSVNLWFAKNPHCRGIFNVGTGKSQTFNDVANAVIQWHGVGSIEYIPFPDHLKGRYQSYTEADISRLRSVGYDAPFQSVEAGVSQYYNDPHFLDQTIEEI